MEGFMGKAFRLLHEMHKPLTCRQMWANFMRDKLVVGWTAAKSKFVAQSRPALYYSQQQVEHARWETRNSQVEGFCIEYIVAAFS